MAYQATQFADCQTIIKTFERAAAYSPTEESVFAMLTPVLQNIRANAGAFVEQSEIELNLAQETSSANKSRGADTQSSNIGYNLDKASEDDEAIGTSINNKPNIEKVRNPNPTVVSKTAGTSITSTLGTSSDDVDFTDPVKEGYLNSIETLSDAFTFDTVNDKIDSIEAANWYKDCIGCKIRPGTLEELTLQSGINGVVFSFLDALEEMWKQVLQQYEKMKELFNQDPYLDLCAFIKWLQSYVCIPDLARIIAALMALMSRIAFDFGGIIGIILSLVAVLIQPFLTNLVNALQKFLLLIIRPIECIIDKLQLLLAKGGELFTIFTELEHSSIARNINATQLPVTTRRGGNFLGADLGGTVTGNALGVDLHEDQNATRSIDASFGLKEYIDAQRAKNQQAVEAAQKELENLNKASKNVDVSNPAAVENFNNKRDQARDNLRNAVEKRDLSTIQRINKRIDNLQKTGRSIISDFIQYLREAVRVVEAFINGIWDELKKLMMEFGGGHNSFIADLIKKMGIIQMIQLAYALISRKGLKGCDNESDDVLKNAEISGLLGATSNSFAVWTDDEGNVHIEDNNDGLTDAIDAVIEAFGSDPNSPIKPGTNKAKSGLVNVDGSLSPTEQGVTGNELGKNVNNVLNNLNLTDLAATSNAGGARTAVGAGGVGGTGSNLNTLLSKASGVGQNGSPISPLANSKDLKQIDKGNTTTDAIQKLKSLIQLTGDPVLDTQIARATEAVTARTNITYKCPLQTSVSNAEQVNKWIDELNQ